MTPTDHVPLSFCQKCKPSFATSQSMLDHRQKMQHQFPDVRLSACPHCGSADWATSDAFVEPDPPAKWWQFWK
jgi:hypothetical protein